MMNQQINIDEYKNHLKKYFLNVVPETNPDALNELLEHFTFERFAKKQLNLLLNQLAVKDIKEDKEITNLLVPENTIVIGAYSIITGEKNYSNYEAFEETYVLKLNYAVLESFYGKYHSLEHLGRLLVEKYYTAFMKKTYDVLFLSAEERYQIFIKDHSELINRVPLRYIALYLGITQETLSRLRAKY